MQYFYNRRMRREDILSMIEPDYFLLQDLDDGEVDAIIITTKTEDVIKEIISEVKSRENYTWEDILSAMPENTKVIECFSKTRRIFY